MDARRAQEPHTSLLLYGRAMREDIPKGELRVRNNVSQKSFAASMLWDLERMIDENQEWEYIVISVHRRLSKYLNYDRQVLAAREQRERMRR